MTPYEHFDASQFMQDPDFRSWVRNETPETAARWEAWLREHPDQAAAVQQAREWLQAIWEGFDDLPEAELQAHLEALRQQREDATEAPRFIGRRLGGWGWAAAASVAVVVGLGWWSLRNERVPPSTPVVPGYREATARAEHSASLREVANTTGRPSRVSLPDGSTVTLHPRSKISYDPGLATQARRAVYLTGEAFFEVVRQPTRPFMVFANGVITKVLGTSFRIKAYETAPITVSVRTGRVSVFAPRPTGADKPVFAGLENGVVLTPNQQAVYSANDDRLVKSIVPKPVLLHPENARTEAVFTDAPVGRLFRQLEASYGIEIFYDEAAFGDCLITARLYDEPLLDKLSLICKTIGASYEVVDARIIISGQGCR
jgi:ferric-dicitrate binding protein FerR (iron transport regulator)